MIFELSERRLPVTDLNALGMDGYAHMVAKIPYIMRVDI